MIRLHSESDLQLCGRCGKYWTGTPDGHCTFCTAKLAPVDWLWFATLALGGFAIGFALYALVTQ